MLLPTLPRSPLCSCTTGTPRTWHPCRYVLRHRPNSLLSGFLKATKWDEEIAKGITVQVQGKATPVMVYTVGDHMLHVWLHDCAGPQS